MTVESGLGRARQAVLLTLVTGGLYAPAWWYGVLRRLGAQGRLWAIASAVALAVVIGFVWASAIIFATTPSLPIVVGWALLLGGIWTLYSLSEASGRLRALGEPDVQPPPAKRTVRGAVRSFALGGAVVLFWVVAWPILVVRGIYSTEQRLDEAARRRLRGRASRSTWAWAGWTRWRGHRRLLLRVARACVAAAEYKEGGEPRCRIAIFALGDVERFRSVRDLGREATPEALRRFDRILVNVAGGPVRIRLSFDAARGVVLRVHGSKADAVAARRTVAAAVKRGSPRWSETTMGDGSTGAPITSAFASARWRTERRLATGAVALAGVASFVGFLLAGEAFEMGDWVVAAVLGVTAAAATTSFVLLPGLSPGVRIAETAARERAREIGSRLAPAVLSALIGAAFKLLLG